MAILVTRPAPDNQKTAAALRARGYDVLLAPMLHFEPVPVALETDQTFGAVIATSANALRALASNPALARLKSLPLFAVGDHTARMAREMEFVDVTSAAGDSAALRDLVASRFGGKSGKVRRDPLLYLAGENLSRNLEAELAACGLRVVTKIAYRMTPVHALPHDVEDAFSRGLVDAVLHYSARSARAFVDAARDGGLEISALALTQGCLSPHVAAVLREAGAGRIVVAARPDEADLFDGLARLLPAPRAERS